MTAPEAGSARHRRLFEAAQERHRRIEERPLLPGVPSALDRAVQLYGSRLAWRSVDGGAYDLDYAQLRAASLIAASGLQRLGVVPGDRVALVLPNVPEFLIAWLGILRLGAIAVPLNHTLTAPELDHCLKLARPSHAILSAEACARLVDSAALAGGGIRRVVVGENAPGATAWQDMMATGGPGSMSFPEIDIDQPATILFTSGTTGFPKAVLHSHLFWLTMGRALADRGPRVERILADTPLFYLAGLWRFMMALEHGGALFVAQRYSLSQLLERVDTHRIDFFTANGLVAKIDPGGWRPRHRIARVNIAGLNPGLHARVEALFDAPAREGYGMTEAGAVLYMPFDNDLMTGSGACGIASPYRECSLRDPDGREVSAGEAGELWVRGLGLCEGYFGDPEATAALFRDGWLRTGDLFRQDAFGYFHLSGRMKEMIRRGGENIAAREVEAVLAEMDQIAEAAVVAVPDPERGQEVLAYLQPAAGWTAETLLPAAVIEHCRSRLARYKLPRFLCYVTEFPRTASNKVAKAQLSETHRPVFDTLLNRWD